MILIPLKSLIFAVVLLPLLQARLDNKEAHPNVLASRFTLAGSFNVGAAGSSAWIPLPRFAKNARDVGFVDFNSMTVPMIEHYKSKGVRSLVLCAIELAEGKAAVMNPGSQIEIGRRIIKVDSLNQTVARPGNSQSVHGISFLSLMNGAVDASLLKNKVVILAYDGAHAEVLSTPYGPMSAHRYFVNILRSIYDGAKD